MRSAIALLGLLALGACATDAASPAAPKVVYIPAPVSCIPADMPDEPAKPATPSSLKAAPGPAERYQQLAEYEAIMDPYADLAAKVIASCKKAASPAPAQ